MSFERARSARPTRNSTDGGKYLAFVLGGREWGLALPALREVSALPADASLLPAPPGPAAAADGSANTPPYVSVRGRAVPVVDMHGRLGLVGPAVTSDTRVLVLGGRRDEFESGAALIVDRVVEVVDIRDQDVEAPPVLGQAAARLVRGQCRLGPSTRLLLDGDGLLTAAAVGWDGGRPDGSTAPAESPVSDAR